MGGVRELYGEDGTAGSQGPTGEAQIVEPPPPPPPPPQEQQPAGAGAEAGAANMASDPVGQPLEGPAGDTGGVQQPPEGLAPPSAREESAEEGDDETGGGEGMAERARAFVEKKMEEAVQNLRKDLGERHLAYDAVLAIRKKDLVTKHLLGGVPAAMPDVGSFVSTADRRLLRTTLEVSVGQRRATSTSLTPRG
jgi:hypothetical protein